jgi:hypothetical protein
MAEMRCFGGSRRGTNIVTAVPAVEDVNERAEKQEHVGQGAEELGPMFLEQEEGHHEQEDSGDEKRRETASAAGNHRRACPCLVVGHFKPRIR